MNSGLATTSERPYKYKAEGPGLEPGRACARRFSRPLPYQLGLALRALKINNLRRSCYLFIGRFRGTVPGLSLRSSPKASSRSHAPSATSRIGRCAVSISHSLRTRRHHSVASALRCSGAGGNAPSRSAWSGCDLQRPVLFGVPQPAGRAQGLPAMVCPPQRRFPFFMTSKIKLIEPARSKILLAAGLRRWGA